MGLRPRVVMGLRPRVVGLTISGIRARIRFPRDMEIYVAFISYHIIEITYSDVRCISLDERAPNTSYWPRRVV